VERIIFFSRSNPFQTNGASSNRARGLVEGIISQGAKVDFFIVSPFFSNREKICYFKSAVNSHDSLRINQLSNLVIESSFIQRIYNYFFIYFFEIFFAKKISKILSDFNGTVFTSPDYFLMKQLSKLKDRNSNIKLVCEVSEYPDYYRSQDIPKWILPKLIKTESFFNNVFVNKLSACVVMTKALYVFFEKLNIPNLKLLHLPMTVDLARFKNKQIPLLNFQKPYILFVGVMNNAKDGVDILIDAFAQISDKYPKYCLYLVGPWQYDTPGHLKRIKELGLIDRIFWHNEVGRDEIPPLLLEASLLALPRPDSKQAQGGFPTKLGEYLASGNPVCATTVGEIPDYLTDNESVFFADPGSIPSFADAMNRALENETRANHVAKNGRLISEKFFNKDIQASILHNFLIEITNNSKIKNN
jgi:glycosyltransferase involved in cell wall biosynthesis